MPLPDPGTPQQGPSARLSLAAAHLSLVSSVVALASLGSLHVRSPEFDPSSRVVSEYALGRYPWVLAIVFFAWAVSSWALGFALRRELRAWSCARKLLLWNANLPWIGFLPMAVAMFSLTRKTGHPLLRIGWPNRLLIVFYLAWTIAVAWHAIRVDNLAMRGSA